MRQLRNFTVGIPTYYGGPSLVKTVESILRAAKKVPVQIVIAVDGNPLDREIEKQLKKYGCQIFFSRQRGGQVARLNDIIRLTKTKYLVLTQDDVIFAPNTLWELKKTFDQRPEITMTAGLAEQLPPKTWVESVVHMGTLVTQHLALDHFDGDHYLVAVGRCLAFRSQILKGSKLPLKVICSDAYFYFLNQKKNGGFVLSEKARYKIRSPQTLKEHFKQSKKFALLRQEMWQYLHVDTNQSQPVTFKQYLSASLKVFTEHPGLFTLYALVLVYSRILSLTTLSHNSSVLWETDISTKNI